MSTCAHVHWVCVCVCFGASQSEAEAHHVVTVSCSYCSPLPPFLGRKETRAVCVCVFDTVCVCVSERASGLTHIILNRIFPSRVLLPLSFRSLPQDSRLSTNSAAGAESPLFVLERHCSGAAEAMSQHRRHSAHLPRIAQLLNVWVLLCHLAFPHGIYRSKSHSQTSVIGWGEVAGSLQSDYFLKLCFFLSIVGTQLSHRATHF